MKKNANIKILQVTSGFRKGVSGGIPSILFNYTTDPAFDDNEIGFDYLSLGYQTYEPYREDFESRGSELFTLDIHSHGTKQFFAIVKRLCKFIKVRDYDIIHINSGALVQVLACAIAAKIAGSKNIIIHCHSAMIKPLSRRIMYVFLKPIFNIVVDQYFACAELAANSMFPKNILKGHKWTYIPNAIHISRFRYDEGIRTQYRDEFGLDGKFVLGHVGRLNAVKNHSFLLDVFNGVLKQRENAVLLLVGAGDLKEDIQNKAKQLGMEDKVVFAGQRRDANNIMQAMDVFAFPSLYEGLGMVAVEAQVSGLKVIASDVIPQETRVTDNIKYLPITNPEPWVKAILEIDGNYVRVDQSERVSNCGFELSIAAKQLRNIYLNCKK